MSKAHLIAAAGVALLLSTGAHATVAQVDFGGRFDPGFSNGYVWGVIDYGLPQNHDNTGLQKWADVDFSRPAISPGPLEVSFDTPNFGEVTWTETGLRSFAVTPAGEFFTLNGTFDDGLGYGFLSVNMVFPGHGIPSFGLYGSFNYSPPPPPQCTSPECIPWTPIGPSNPVGTVPEASTWAMMAMGFASLGFAGYRRQRTQRLAVLT